MKKFIILALLAQGFFLPNATAQIKGKAPAFNRGVPYRPKLAEFSYYQLDEYETRSSSREFGNSRSEVERDSQMKVRLGIPMIIKDSKILGVQLKYDKQNFLLDFENTPEAYELYDHIEAKSFVSIGARFFFHKTLDNDREVTLVAGGEIKSDKLVINQNTSKYYAHFGYAKQINSRTKMGGGLMISYALGSPQIYPLFQYEHQLNNKWTLDLKLPKQAALRYKASERFYITAITEVKGWRYAIHNSKLSSDETLILRKSDINFGLSIEHEIHDWLWMGIDTGLSKNLRYFLAAPGDNRWDAVVDVTPKDAPYLKIGLYIVPPKKLYK